MNCAPDKVKQQLQLLTRASGVYEKDAINNPAAETAPEAGFFQDDEEKDEDGKGRGSGGGGFDVHIEKDIEEQTEFR